MSTFTSVSMHLSDFLTKGIQTCISLVRVLLMSRPVTHLPPPQNKICSILGNGPSLSTSLEQHLDIMKDTDLVCVNTFATYDYFEQLKPENYVIIDPLFFSEEGSKNDAIISTFKALKDKTTWHLNLFVPLKVKKSSILQDLLAQKPNIKVVYFNYTIFEGFDFIKHFFFSKGLAMPQSENVMIATLYLMINRNYEYIYLYGADHSWHEHISIREDNILTIKVLHFYNPDAAKEKEQLLYNEDKKRKTMANQFLSISKAFRGHEILKIYADSKKTKIFNASTKSYVDAFERIKFN
ncbi:MAG: hypothetical protein J7604_11730 [Sporocytophaga sp.]|uniref:hypothetical protein n=1 Tax=Sporocytophaga sp. TaxID=2231183 RepID=UPI001B1AF1BC|nr:hypothetical protein [Sporocytophaga sp.]MBO9700872.1 hypothetical protein [Sporocytophaga sp.]